MNTFESLKPLVTKDLIIFVPDYQTDTTLATTKIIKFTTKNNKQLYKCRIEAHVEGVMPTSKLWGDYDHYNNNFTGERTDSSGPPAKARILRTSNSDINKFALAFWAYAGTNRLTIKISDVEITVGNDGTYVPYDANEAFTWEIVDYDSTFLDNANYYDPKTILPQVANKQANLPAIASGVPQLFYNTGGSAAGATPQVIPTNTFPIWYGITGSTTGTFASLVSAKFIETNGQKRSLYGYVLANASRTDLPAELTYPAIYQITTTNDYNAVNGTIVDASQQQWNIRITSMSGTPVLTTTPVTMVTTTTPVASSTQDAGSTESIQAKIQRTVNNIADIYSKLPDTIAFTDNYGGPGTFTRTYTLHNCYAISSISGSGKLKAGRAAAQRWIDNGTAQQGNANYTVSVGTLNTDWTITLTCDGTAMGSAIWYTVIQGVFSSIDIS